jgi:threonine aldolase
MSLGSPMNFSSDTAAPAHPAILQAMVEASQGPASSYGADPWTDKATAALAEIFETDLDVWLVSSGTAANALGLSLFCPPHGAILAHEESHIERDERGAPEFFTGGGKVALLGGSHAKINFTSLKKRIAANHPEFVHETPISVLSLSNLTECGAAYTAAEIAERAAVARAAGLFVHVDGSRFANALVSTGVPPSEMSWRAGVDIMSFGATKNGAVGCEAIILFGRAREKIGELRARAKRSGHMPPKMRFLAAQMLAYLKNGLWLELAGKANASAHDLADLLVHAGAELAHPVDGNEVFCRLPAGYSDRLRQAGCSFYPWLDGSHRFVCSWSTTPEEIAAVSWTLRKNPG